MIFTTPQFVLFFTVFLCLWTTVRGRGKKWLLLLSSYAFYASWNPKFLLLIVLSTWVDFWVGRKLAETHDQKQRRRLLWISIAVNLGTLAFFKYCNFFIASAVAGLSAMGIETSITSLKIILPVGISFYTFQTMSYTIDIYRKRMNPTKSLQDFSVYVAFFPQLVAGPIERARRLLPQIETVGQTNRYDSSGWGLIAIGCFKKVVIADNMAAIVDAVYADPSGAYGPAIWLATYAFAIQIYCDFSGYSDIAVGLARLMGIQLIQNFEAPYAAAGPSEFWRRWHISLSTWLRDYLYITLGGNRGSRWFTHRNLMLTMLLGGLWHGAAWNFVLWGAWHGALLIVFRAAFWNRLKSSMDALPGGTQVGLWIRRIVFFHLVCIGWAFFRAESMVDCQTAFFSMINITNWDLSIWVTMVQKSGHAGWLLVSMGTCLAVILSQMVWPVGSNRVVDGIWQLPASARLLFVSICLYAAALAAPEQAPPFIYFQF